MSKVRVFHMPNKETGKSYCGKGKPSFFPSPELLRCRSCERISWKSNDDRALEPPTILPQEKKIPPDEGWESDLQEINSALHPDMASEEATLRQVEAVLDFPRGRGEGTGGSGGYPVILNLRGHRERIENQVMKRLYGYVPLGEIEGRPVAVLDLLYHLWSPFLRWRARVWMKRNLRKGTRTRVEMATDQERG